MTLSVNSNTGQDALIFVGEFREAGDSEEELADPMQQGAISNSLFRHLTFLLLFLFYNPDTINLHVLIMLPIGGIINAMLLPVLFKSV